MIKIISLGFASIFLSCCQIFLVAEEPNQQEKSSIKWNDLDHYTKYEMKLIRGDETVLGNRRFNWRELNDGVVLLFCDQSGGLLRMFPSKNNFEVLVFPDPNIAEHRFRVAQGKELKELGIDVDALVGLIHPATHPMGKSSSKYRLRARIESRVRIE